MAEEVSESYDQMDKGLAEGKKFMSLESGVDTIARIVNGPFMFRKLFADVPDGKGGVNRIGLTLPFEAQVAGYDSKATALFEVVILNGPAAGQHKLLEANATQQKKIRKIAETWGSARTPDLVFSKSGSGMQTKYDVTAVPAKKSPFDFSAQIPLRQSIKYSTAQEIAKLPQVSAVEEADKLAADKPTPAQAKQVRDLCVTKEISLGALSAKVKRMFGEDKSGDIEELTGSQVSELLTSLAEG